MDNGLLTVIGLGGLTLGILLVIGFSILVMARDGGKIAEQNRKANNPVSNGFAIPAAIAVTVIFVIVFVLGILPPILRRGG